MTSNTLAHLTFCRRVGLIPVPLKPRSKEPWVERGDRWKPTPEELEAWDSQGVNWRFRCGENLGAPDFDCEDAYYRLITEHLLPGVTHLSERDQQHLQAAWCGNRLSGWHRHNRREVIPFDLAVAR